MLSQLRERSGSAPASSNGKLRSEAVASQPGQPSSVELPDTVITEELLKSHARPGVAIRIPGNAILTPTARDYIQAHRISLDRNQTSDMTKAAARGVSQGIIIASHLPEIVHSLLADVRKHWKANWKVEIEAGLLQVVERAQSAICRAESGQALIFAKAPHQLACLVNRNADCRAAVVRSAEDVRLVREELAANVLCVDLVQPTYIGLRGILRSSMETSSLIQNPVRSES